MDFLETPSRLIRRMAEHDAREADIPSLPSFSMGYDSDSMAPSSTHALHDVTESESESELEGRSNWKEPVQSTPAATSVANSSRTIQRLPRSGSSTASRVRFANSIMTRSTGLSTPGRESFEVSRIPHAKFSADQSVSDPSQRSMNTSQGGLGSSTSHNSLPEIYLPPEEDELQEGLSVVNALEPVSGPGSPVALDTSGNKSYRDLEVSIRSEPKVASPFDQNRWGINITKRRPGSRNRIPSLTHSQSSDTSSSSNATPSVHGSLPRTSPGRRLNTSDEESVEEREIEDALSQDDPQDRTQITRSNESDRSREQQEETTRSSNLSLSGPSRIEEIDERPNHSPLSHVFASPASAFSPAHQGTPNIKRNFVVVTSAARPRLKTPTPHLIRRARFSLPQPTGTPAFLATPNSANDSYISTASSHNLMVHRRPNASFDHIADKVGKLDKGKLQGYLASVNRRLHEENDTLHGNNHELLQQANKLAEEKKILLIAIDMLQNGLERHEERISELEGELPFDYSLVEGEDVMEQAATIARLPGRTQELEAELENVVRELEKERELRRLAGYSWRERLDQEIKVATDKLEQGWKIKLENAINPLKDELTKAKDRLEASQGKLALAEQTVENRDEEIASLKDRLAKEKDEAEQVLAAEERAEGYRVAKEQAEKKVTTLQRDLSSIKAKLIESNDEIVHHEGRINELEVALRSRDDVVHELEQKYSRYRDNEDQLRRRLAEAESTGEQYASQLASKEDSSQASSARFEALKQEAYDANEVATRAEEELAQLRDALQNSEDRIAAYQEEKAAFDLQLASLERERNELQQRLSHARSAQKDAGDSRQSHVEDDEDRILISEHDKVVEDLENQLDLAHRQISRLRYEATDSPGRRALQQAKDLKIELLEQQKQELLERIEVLKETIANLGPGFASIEASIRANSTMNKSATPAKHRSVLALRTPGTPVASLKDKSWMNDTHNVSEDVAGLLAQIDLLTGELAQANDHVDNKLEELESAGFGIVGLTKEVEMQKDRNVELQREIERLGRREDRIVQRLERCKCAKCGKRFDASGAVHRALGDISNVTTASEEDQMNSRSIENLQWNEKLESLKAELEGTRQRLQQEKTALEDQARSMKLRVQKAETDRADMSDMVKKERRAAAEAVKTVQADAERQLVEAKKSFNDAQATIKHLEDELDHERMKLQDMLNKQEKLSKEKREVLQDLERIKVDMDDVWKELDAAKRHGIELESRARETSRLGRDVQTLNSELAQNQQLVAQLRQERDTLSGDLHTMQRRYTDLTKHADSLRKEVSTLQAAHDGHRHKLDLQVTEMEEMRGMLDQKKKHEKSSQAVAETEKRRLSAERAEYAAVLATCQADLQRVRKEASRFREDLDALREEREMMEVKMRKENADGDRHKAQSQSQIRLLKEHLVEVQEKARVAEENLAGYVAASHKTDGAGLAQLREQHKKECKGLITQIRYLKAKFTRESALRNDLAYQKTYLIKTIEAMEQSEEAVLATIARIGFPKPVASPRKRRTLKSVGFMIMFLRRVSKASELWREQSGAKDAVAAALNDVRRRRQIGNTVARG